MKRSWLSFIARNALGLLALLLAHNILDPYYLDQPFSLSRWSPYLFLALMYGWIVFHNRILFERLFLRGNRVAYFGWLLLFLLIGTMNMHLILRGLFDVANTLPFILRYYSDTVTGFGVYVTYRYLTAKPTASSSPTVTDTTGPTTFTYLSNGASLTVSVADIAYVEGLENYIKVVTPTRTHIVRMTLKEAESRLPKQQFIRISKSHIVNVAQAERINPDEVHVRSRTLRIGRVYKRYVAEQLQR